MTKESDLAAQYLDLEMTGRSTAGSCGSSEDRGTRRVAFELTLFRGKSSVWDVTTSLSPFHVDILVHILAARAGGSAEGDTTYLSGDGVGIESR